MIENVISRWEWRTFGEEFGEAEVNIRSYKIDQIRDSDEIYLLSENNNNNIKLRRGLLDIKILKMVGDNHLELWEPTMKESFPVKKREIEKLFIWSHSELPRFEREEYTSQQFLDELIIPRNNIKSLNVHKKRTGFTIDNCEVEIAEVKVNNITTRTIAVELEDPQKVISTVRKLGLERFENINYLKGLKKAIGMKY